MSVRCPECGAVVPSFFSHVDRDCTGAFPEKVAAGQLLAQDTPEEEETSEPCRQHRDDGRGMCAHCGHAIPGSPYG